MIQFYQLGASNAANQPALGSFARLSFARPSTARRSFLDRKRNNPRVRSGLPCVRSRFEAVETPLNRTKKSRNARKKLFLSLRIVTSNLVNHVGQPTIPDYSYVGAVPQATRCTYLPHFPGTSLSRVPFLVPDPRCANNPIQFRVARFPSHFANRFF
jgi:hypothetical protein